MHNKVKVNIAGTFYVISTDKDPHYVKKLVKEINGKIALYMRKNESLTINGVLILILLEYMDNNNELKISKEILKEHLNKYEEERALVKQEVSDLKNQLEFKNKGQ